MLAFQSQSDAARPADADFRLRRAAGLTTLIAALAPALLLASRPARAHGDAAHTAAKKTEVVREQTDWGIAGDARSAARTIEVSMSDAMRFTPDHIEVRQGQTIRFVYRNRGVQLHEFVLGNRAALEAHAALMLKFPNMEHDEPYMAHVPPGQSVELTWTFNRAGEFDYACLIPGHYQAGMVGRVVVSASDAPAKPGKPVKS